MYPMELGYKGTDMLALFRRVSWHRHGRSDGPHLTELSIRQQFLKKNSGR